MADVFKVTAVWTGFVGSPGYSKFAFQLLDTQTALDAAGTAVRTFFDSIKVLLQPSWTVQVQSEIAIFDMATGRLTNQATMTTTPAPVVGTSAQTTYVGGAGAYVAWRTPIIFNGHRVQGRTFLVPLAATITTDGTLAPSTITTIQGAGNALIATSAADFVIWSKQFNMVDNKPVQVGGALGPVTSCSVPDKTGILRSRRD